MQNSATFLQSKPRPVTAVLGRLGILLVGELLLPVLVARAQVPVDRRLARTGGHGAPQALGSGPTNCTLAEAPGPLPAQWLPDRDLARARQLTNNQLFQALGEAAVSLPIGNGADPIGAAASGTALVDGHVPLPGNNNRAVVTPCKLDEHGVPIKDANGNYIPDTPVAQFLRTLVRLRFVTNFSVEPTSDTATAAQKDARTITSPEGGLVNLQLSRYLFGVDDGDFAFYWRLMGGAGLHQVIPNDAAGKPDPTQTDYRTLLYASAQFSARSPIIPTSGSSSIAHLLLATEPFVSSIPTEMRATLQNKTSIYGIVGRGYIMAGDKFGAGVTRRWTTPAVPRSAQYSIDVIVLR